MGTGVVTGYENSSLFHAVQNPRASLPNPFFTRIDILVTIIVTIIDNNYYCHILSIIVTILNNTIIVTTHLSQ